MDGGLAVTRKPEPGTTACGRARLLDRPELTSPACASHRQATKAVCVCWAIEAALRFPVVRSFGRGERRRAGLVRPPAGAKGRRGRAPVRRLAGGCVAGGHPRAGPWPGCGCCHGLCRGSLRRVGPGCQAHPDQASYGLTRQRMTRTFHCRTAASASSGAPQPPRSRAPRRRFPRIRLLPRRSRLRHGPDPALRPQPRSADACRAPHSWGRGWAGAWVGGRTLASLISSKGRRRSPRPPLCWVRILCRRRSGLQAARLAAGGDLPRGSGSGDVRNEGESGVGGWGGGVEGWPGHGPRWMCS